MRWKIRRWVENGDPPWDLIDVTSNLFSVMYPIYYTTCILVSHKITPSLCPQIVSLSICSSSLYVQLFSSLPHLLQTSLHLGPAYYCACSQVSFTYPNVGCDSSIQIQVLWSQTCATEMLRCHVPRHHNLDMTGKRHTHSFTKYRNTKENKEKQKQKQSRQIESEEEKNELKKQKKNESYVLE